MPPLMAGAQGTSRGCRMSDTPVLRYTGTSISRQQTLTLYEDRVHLEGKIFLEADYTASIALGSLSPDYHRVSGRDRLFWGSFLLMLGSAALALIYHQFPWADIGTFVGGLLTSLPLAGLIGCLVTIRKVCTAQFVNTQGQLVFSVIKSGKEKHRYEEVVATIAQQIRNAKSPGPSDQGYRI